MNHFKSRTEATPLTLPGIHVTPILLYLNKDRQCTREGKKGGEGEEDN